jgi:hypothetical protein
VRKEKAATKAIILRWRPTCGAGDQGMMPSILEKCKKATVSAVQLAAGTQDRQAPQAPSALHASWELRAGAWAPLADPLDGGDLEPALRAAGYQPSRRRRRWALWSAASETACTRRWAHVLLLAPLRDGFISVIWCAGTPDLVSILPALAALDGRRRMR